MSIRNAFFGKKKHTYTHITLSFKKREKNPTPAFPDWICGEDKLQRGSAVFQPTLIFS